MKTVQEEILMGKPISVEAVTAYHSTGLSIMVENIRWKKSALRSYWVP